MSARRRPSTAVVLSLVGAVVVLSVVGAALAEELPGQQDGSSTAHLGAWSFVTAVGGVLLVSAGAQCVPAPDRS